MRWFDRARFKFHQESSDPRYQVLLGQFGRVVHPSDARFFPETGHNVARQRFLDFWEANGGLAQFGYPISEEFDETLEEGKSYCMQYFERARLEYHQENAQPYDVLFGPFGRCLLNQR